MVGERRPSIRSSLPCTITDAPYLPQSSSGNTLALQVDSDGNVRYDAIGSFFRLSPCSSSS